jgi:hypothetical protein
MPKLRLKDSMSLDGFVAGSAKSSGWAVALVLSFVLALIVMVLLVDHYPALQNEAMIVGLSVFFFLMFFDLSSIVLLIGLEYRAGEGWMALKLAGGLLLFGFLAAFVIGGSFAFGVAAVAKLVAP